MGGGKEAGKLPGEGNDTVVKRKKERRKETEKRRKDCNESRGRQTRVKLATSLFLLSLRRKRKTRRSFPSPLLEIHGARPRFKEHEPIQKLSSV